MNLDDLHTATNAMSDSRGQLFISYQEWTFTLPMSSWQVLLTTCCVTMGLVSHLELY